MSGADAPALPGGDRLPRVGALRARVAELETHNLRLRTVADDAEDALRDLATFGELDADRIAEQRRALGAAVDATPVKP